MRLSSLAVATLVAVLPAAGRADDASSPGASTAPAPAIAGSGAEVRAATPSLPATPVDPAQSEPSPGPWSRLRWGLALGAGFPDFATASLTVRPVSHVRLFAGPSWNYVAWGLHGGVAFVPWDFVVAPVVSFEAGKFFGTNLGFLARDGGSAAAGMKPLLEDMDYSYAALDVGVEIGSQRGLSTSIRLGLSYVSLGANGTATYTSDSGTVVSMKDPVLKGTLPSLKIGVQYWF